MPLQEQGAEALRVHNVARAAKGVGPLQWDTRLAKDAKEYARILSVKRFLEHAKCEDGENLYQQSCGDCTYADAVKAWLGEEVYYHGQKIPEGDFEAYGHYSKCPVDSADLAYISQLNVCGLRLHMSAWAGLEL